MTSPLTYGYQPQYHYVCARQRIAHCPAVEKGTSQTAPTDVGPRRASGGGLRDPVARTRGCRGAREGLDPGKIRGAVSYPGHKRTQATSFMAVTSLGAEPAHADLKCKISGSKILNANTVGNHWDVL